MAFLVITTIAAKQTIDIREGVPLLTERERVALTTDLAIAAIITMAIYWKITHSHDLGSLITHKVANVGAVFALLVVTTDFAKLTVRMHKYQQQLRIVSKNEMRLKNDELIAANQSNTRLTQELKTKCGENKTLNKQLKEAQVATERERLKSRNMEKKLQTAQLLIGKDPEKKINEMEAAQKRIAELESKLAKAKNEVARTQSRLVRLQKEKAQPVDEQKLKNALANTQYKLSQTERELEEAKSREGFYTLYGRRRYN